MMSMGLALGIFLTAFVMLPLGTLQLKSQSLQICSPFGLFCSNTSPLYIPLDLQLDECDGYDVLRTFRAKRSRFVSMRCGLFVKYSIYGWSAPLIVIGFAFAVANLFPQLNLSPLYADDPCRLVNHHSFFAFWTLPVGLMLIANLILFTITAKTFYNAKDETRSVHSFQDKRSFSCTQNCSPMFGLSWLLSYITAAMKLQFIWFIVSCVNCLHGVFMFLYLFAIGVCSEKSETGLAIIQP